MPASPLSTVLETIAAVNCALASDPNTIMGVTTQGETPEAAYVRLVAGLASLASR